MYRACYEFALECDHRNRRALYRLALHFHDGTGGLKNITKAYELYEAAAKLGCENSTIVLLSVHHPTFTTAQQWFDLGMKYYHGRGGYPKSQVVAYVCYEKAFKLDSNHCLTNYYMGWMYEHGEGHIEKDKESAESYYEVAAKAGCQHSRAQLQKMAPRSCGLLNMFGLFSTTMKEATVPYDPQSDPQANVAARPSVRRS